MISSFITANYELTSMLQVSQAQLAKFQKIKSLFYPNTKVPIENNWQSRSDNELWLEIVGQVIVAGNSTPYEKLKNNSELKERIAYENLLEVKGLENLRATINQVLLSIGSARARFCYERHYRANSCLKTSQ